MAFEVCLVPWSYRTSRSLLPRTLNHCDLLITVLAAAHRCPAGTLHQLTLDAEYNRQPIGRVIDPQTGIFHGCSFPYIQFGAAIERPATQHEPCSELL